MLYWLLKKYLNEPVLLKSANEAFRDGSMSDTFWTGLTKIISKNRNAKEMGDWRPITVPYYFVGTKYEVELYIVANRLDNVKKK